MTDMCYICLLGVIILSFLPTGTTGEETHVFSCPGENVILPCNNDLSDCTSTTWIYGKYSTSVELFTEGQKRNNRERSERLSLGSHCSLNIYKTTEEDYGQYICQQYVNKQKQGNDASVYLNVLKVSLSSTQTEMRPGRSLTLSCQLFSYVSCDTLVRIEGIQLFWVNQAGVNLQTDSRYHISSSGQCIITLTTTLLNEDNNREWRCLIKKNNEIKTSARYTVRFMTGQTGTMIPTINQLQNKSSTTPVTSTQQTGKTTLITQTTEQTSSPPASSPPKQQETVTVPVIAAVVFLFAIVLFGVICMKRADRRRADNSVVTDKNDNDGAYDTINMTILPAPSTSVGEQCDSSPISSKEQNDDVTYSEVICSTKQVKENNVYPAENVTYAAIRKEKVEPQDDCGALYASLNKTPCK